MAQLDFECRKCKKITRQIIQGKITDNLPPGVEVIQCTKCELLTVASVGTERHE